MGIETQALTTVYGVINGSMSSFIGSAQAGLTAWVLPPLRAGAALYFLIMGFSVLRGAISTPIKELVWQACKISLLLFAIGQVGNYTSVIQGMGAQLSTAVSGQASQNPGQIMDHYFGGSAQISVIVHNAFQSVPACEPLDFSTCSTNAVYDGMAQFALVVLYLVAGFSACVGFVIVIMAQLALNIMVALMPIALASLLYSSTRFIFQGWLSQTLNYVFLFVIMTLVTGIITAMQTSLFSTLVQANSGTVPASVEAPAIFAQVEIYVIFGVIIYLLGTLFFFQVPALAAGISGGAQSAGHNFLAVGANQVLSRVGRGGGRAAAGASAAPAARTGGTVSSGNR